MVYSLVEFCSYFCCCMNSTWLLWKINAWYIYPRRKTCREAPRAGRWPCFLCTKSDLASPCITVHLMELMRDLTVDRVCSSCLCRSVPFWHSGWVVLQELAKRAINFWLWNPSHDTRPGPHSHTPSRPCLARGDVQSSRALLPRWTFLLTWAATRPLTVGWRSKLVIHLITDHVRQGCN